LARRTIPPWSAFVRDRLVASGTLVEVALAIRETDAGGGDPVLVIDNATGRPLDLDLRGTADEVRERYEAPVREATAQGAPRRRGRPRLGVVSREVTLLPRHWAWLSSQRGGASATLRRLVDQARRTCSNRDRGRAAQDAAFRFLSAIAGDRPGFEDAIRALYAGDGAAFAARIEAWPADVRAHGALLAAASFSRDGDP
jgi:hypothetical protein